MTRDRDHIPVRLSVGDRIAVVGLFMALLGMVGGGYAIYRDHDRSLTVLQTEMIAVHRELADVRGDVKQLIGTVSALDALIREHRADASDLSKHEARFEGGQ